MPHSRRDFSILRIPCTKPGCNHWFKNKSGYTQHMNTAHPLFSAAPPLCAEPSQSTRPHLDDPSQFNRSPSPIFNGDIDPIQSDGAGEEDHSEIPHSVQSPTPAEFVGRPCDPEGNFLPPGALPLPLSEKCPNDWTPYHDRLEFELANYIFTKNQTPAAQIDHLLDLWAASLIQAGADLSQVPFKDHRDVYRTIDNTPLGDVKWQSFSVKYTGDIPDRDPTPWMTESYDVWFRDPHQVVQNMLANPDYATKFATEMDERQWQDFMSGDWAWNQADQIAEDPDTHGSTFVPVILSSDKTTVSVATGQNDYYPLYASIGNVHNNVHRAHRGAVAVVGFLAMPKTTKQHAKTAIFRKFHHQLFHLSLSFILQNLKPGMMKPEVVRFGDGHYRHVIYGLGPYIVDYEEQVLLTCIQNSLLWDEYGIIAQLVPFTNDFPQADINELIAPDLLHQIIKGAFKDHLVAWVEKYLVITYGQARADVILDDIDRRIAAVPAFSGLRRFPQGRNFKQWTGDDSKALMKVYLPAIEGYVPTDIVRAFHALLEFCYLVRCNIITKTSLKEIDDAVARFHQYREILKTSDVIQTFSLPRQHSIKHYNTLIRLFGAPNGLCSSITESKHIKAVKEPWRWSSRYKALGQMLVTNQCLDKLTASCQDFHARGMLNGTCLTSVLTVLNMQASREHHNAGQHELPVLSAPGEDNKYIEGTKHAQRIPELSAELDICNLADLSNPKDTRDPTEVPLLEFPHYRGQISIFNSASSTFHAPSNLSGIGGMKREYIRACPSWRNEYARNDCVFVITDSDTHGMQGMDVARVMAFFSLQQHGKQIPCAVGNVPDPDTGMWMVKPAFAAQNTPHFVVIYIDTIFRAAHLIPVFGTTPLSPSIKFYHVLDIFKLFYVNKFADHHAFEIAL
ncbi:uncharacterized protein F5147DRAFT_747167 [Suillus discolor]|uniref:C2H2-type domain-containing protein n=1 Tax=Suillus discolor TaxID=1912936 RepID=A0A9P7JR04_9AGAM|nr:uncharacterized protein F5147DRAFT_747167 [Suillus discolor]KAG2100480.1 hypothetical protein F5147DRAFT_747167 [Suillus discolor]